MMEVSFVILTPVGKFESFFSFADFAVRISPMPNKSRWCHLLDPHGERLP